MAWALLDDNFPTNPKVMAAVHQHALARDLYVCALCYCRRFHTNGHIPTHVLKTIGFVGNERKAAAALLETGLWDRVDGGYQIHDYQKMYASDADDKAGREERRRKKSEAGRKGGLASWAVRSKQTEADAEAGASADSKQPALSSAEAHRGGMVRSGEVLGSGSSERNVTPRFDEWLVELQEAYPRQRVTSGWLTSTAFVDALNNYPAGPVDGWRVMQANLENQKHGHEWRVKRLIPKLQNWLKDGGWLQQHDEHPPEALVGEKTSRTLTSAGAFVKGGDE